MGAVTLAVSGSVSEEGVQADHATMALKELLFEKWFKVVLPEECHGSEQDVGEA